MGREKVTENMVQVKSISVEESRTFLQGTKFGHLAYAYEGQPYIVPIHFGYDNENIYFFTTGGTKTRRLSANPKVCLQVEQVDDFEHWQSVMVIGHAEPLNNSKEIDRAIVCLTERELPLPPEMNKVSLANRVGSNEVAVNRIRPKEITGRRRNEVTT